jgi:enoyl-[acyl-carrier protein] reductase III
VAEAATARWALVTGGSRGIGRAIALELAAQGWDVAIAYLRNDDAAAASAAGVRCTGRRCLVYRANVAKPDECAELLRRFTADSGAPLGALVHAAGLGALSPALATRPGRWQLALDTHVGALVELVTGAQPLFSDGAGVVALTSLGSRRVMPGYASIGAAKGALETVVRYLAAELAPRGVNVNAVCGGPVDTDSLRSFATFDALEQESRMRPSGRLGRPEDIAPVVAFLLGPSARWVRGQVLVADGGFSLS